jgi:hypothetical protein
MDQPCGSTEAKMPQSITELDRDSVDLSMETRPRSNEIHSSIDGLQTLREAIARSSEAERLSHETISRGESRLDEEVLISPRLPIPRTYIDFFPAPAYY